MQIRPLTRGEAQIIRTVASRMKDTLVEVLGEERGASMYSPAWLRERVLFHIESGQVLVALNDGAMLGHCMLRVEGDLGLYATTYVHPAARRAGVAKALVSAGEVWLRSQDVRRLATDTAKDNSKLIQLFLHRGFSVVHTTDEMLRLAKTL